MGSGDQPRYVGNHKRLSPPGLHHTQGRHKGGEWVVSRFGTRCRQSADQCGLAGIGQADNADIGQKFEVEFEDSRLAGFPGLGKPRGTVGR